MRVCVCVSSMIPGTLLSIYHTTDGLIWIPLQ